MRRLLPYNGLNPRKPLLLAISGRVLDVRQGADYYGPGGPYKVMAGRDASKAFAMMSLKEEDAHPDLTGVDESHLKILDDWFDKLTAKYPTVGRVAQSGAPPCSARAADAAPDAARADGGDDADDWYLGPNATPRAGEVRRGTRSKSPARDDS
jgi:membrane-associated progesterone receptor component